MSTTPYLPKPGPCHRQPLEPLIIEAFRSARHRRLVLADICDHVMKNCTDYRDDVTSSDGLHDDDQKIAGRNCGNWKRNLRHILSVRSFFVRTGERNPNGRGGYWTLDERKYTEYINEKTVTSSVESESIGVTSRFTVLPASTSDQPSAFGAQSVWQSSGEVLSAVLRLSALQDSYHDVLPQHQLMIDCDVTRRPSAANSDVIEEGVNYPQTVSQYGIRHHPYHRQKVRLPYHSGSVDTHFYQNYDTIR